MTGPYAGRSRRRGGHLHRHGPEGRLHPPPPSTTRCPTPPATWTMCPTRGRAADLHYALSNSLGFGGPQRLCPVQEVGGLNRMMKYNSDEIAKILPPPLSLCSGGPHRGPARTASGPRASSASPSTSPFFQGHFPPVPCDARRADRGGNGPGGRRWPCCPCRKNKGKLALFGGIKNARFRRQVTPGDVLGDHLHPDQAEGPCGDR